MVETLSKTHTVRARLGWPFLADPQPEDPQAVYPPAQHLRPEYLQNTSRPSHPFAFLVDAS